MEQDPYLSHNPRPVEQLGLNKTPGLQEANRQYIHILHNAGFNFTSHFEDATKSLTQAGLADEVLIEHMTGTIAAQWSIHKLFQEQSGGDHRQLFDISCEDVTRLTPEEVLATIRQGHECARKLATINSTGARTLTPPTDGRYVELSNEDLLRTSALALILTQQSGEILDSLSITILGTMAKQTKTGEKPIIDFDNNIRESEGTTDRRIVTEATIAALRDPQNTFHDSVRTVAPALIKTYRDWLETRELVKLHGTANVRQVANSLAATAEANMNKSPESIEELIAGVQAEINRLLTLHSDQVREFRPSWNQLQKVGLRPFSTDLLRLGRTETNPLPIAESQDAKRITGVLHVLERLGKTDAETLQHKFARIIGSEHTVGHSIQNGRTAIEMAGGDADITAWQPLGADLDFATTHWNAVRPVIDEHWAPRDGSTRPQAVEAISRALNAYKAAKREFEHPERRLESIARPLGAVALPPEAKPQLQTSAGELRRQTARNALRAVASNEQFSTNVRQRTEILDHFMATAAKQVRPGDAESFGQLYISEPVPHGTRYFCVTFRAPDNSEWVLLESLTPDVATFAIPQRLVAQFGTLLEFVKTFGKREQQQLGSQQVIHVHEWTTQSHIARIMQKITDADK
jgi:hypothetical protein